MRPSHPTAFVIKKRDNCAVCNNIAPCPACPQGTQCQQIFRSSCQDCPVNKCVAIPGYTSSGGSNGGALGGGLAALFIVVIGAAAFWFWRRLRAKRRRIALHEDALERREKVRSEKEATTLQLGGNKLVDNSPFAIVGEDDLDGDTEYTQVTGVLNNNNNDEDRLGSLAEPTAFRRRSFGAATHLSRITEGAEEEEEEDQALANNGSAKKRSTIASVRSDARSLASGAGPRVSIGSGTSFGSHNIIPIAFKPSSPLASDAASQRESGAYETLSTLPLPSTAHRATGAPPIQVNQARQGPVRPTRAPDLNLRLPETQRPHQPATSSPLAAAAAASSAAAASEQPYDFMSIDPVEVLNNSGPYTRSDRHLSVGTINTIGSTTSNSLSYVLSAPQVITPVSAEGVRRVQLGNGGKAQLVKVPSLKRKGDKTTDTSADPFRDPAAAEGEEEELLPPPANRFGASAKVTSADRSSTVSTSTLGIPFGENPFGPSPVAGLGPADQTSPSDAGDRFSWLGEDAQYHNNTSSAASEGSDPFRDPASIQRNATNKSSASLRSATSTEAEAEAEGRASIGGLSLLGQFPFDFGTTAHQAEASAMPSDALRQVKMFK